MKKFRKLIPALALLLVSAVLMSTASYAWFSMNKTVTATGMQVNAVSSESLVIATALAVGNQTTVPLTSNVNTLIPATHDTTAVAEGASIAAVNTSTATTGLKYNTNPSAVGSKTGYANSSTVLSFAKAANDGVNKYYEDYIVYIASAGQEMTNTKLQAYLYTGEAITADTTKATSVDFYVSQDSTNMGKFVGTLNLSSLTAAANAQGHTYYSDSLDITLSDKIIPQNGSTTNYIQIVMRVYYDGDLQKTADGLTEITVANSKAEADTDYYDQYGNKQNVVVGETPVTGMYTGTPRQAYVYSETVTTAGTAFNVAFIAVADS